MPVKFFIPGPLREFTNGARLVTIATGAGTVAEALEKLWKEHPGVRDRVLNEQGEVRQHVNVFVGDESIRFTGGLNTPVRDGDEISIVPAVSGG